MTSFFILVLLHTIIAALATANVNSTTHNSALTGTLAGFFIFLYPIQALLASRYMLEHAGGEKVLWETKLEPCIVLASAVGLAVAYGSAVFIGMAIY
jgi:hypothetical protein